MKFVIIFVIFSILLLLDSSFSTHDYLKSLIDDQKLPKVICKIINDITSSNNETHDILIGNLGEKIQSSPLNDFLQCIDDDSAVVVTDLRAITRNKHLRKASVIILVMNEANEVSCY